MAATRAAAAKAINLPEVGDYLTDGKRLVEIVGRDRAGFQVIDSNEPPDELLEHDPAVVEVLHPQAVLRAWRIVKAAPHAA